MNFIPELKSFLKEKSEIYTVRKYDLRDECIEVEGTGWCNRIKFSKVLDKAELLPYVPLSGFPTLSLWWEKILHFIPHKDSPKYLYHVTVCEFQRPKSPKKFDTTFLEHQLANNVSVGLQKLEEEYSERINRLFNAEVDSHLKRLARDYPNEE